MYVFGYHSFHSLNGEDEVGVGRDWSYTPTSIGGGWWAEHSYFGTNI